MPSPFPGMNPYLEQEDAGRDFHERFLPHAAECLSPQVSPAYVVKLEQDLYIHERSAHERRLLGYGDVAVRRTRAPRPASAATAVLQAPSRILLPSVDVESESFLEIRDGKTRNWTCRPYCTACTMRLIIATTFTTARPGRRCPTKARTRRRLSPGCT